jgi:hypothetical protein
MAETDVEIVEDDRKRLRGGTVEVRGHWVSGEGRQVVARPTRTEETVPALLERDPGYGSLCVRPSERRTIVPITGSTGLWNRAATLIVLAAANPLMGTSG